MGKKRILVVDSDEELLIRINEYLYNQGYLVLTTSSSVHGVDLVEKFNFDLVITNFHMPVTNGLIICREIKTKNPKTKVVVMADFAPDIVDDLQEYLQADKRADAIIEKKSDLNALIEDATRVLSEQKRMESKIS